MVCVLRRECMMKVYAASSWRNSYYDGIHQKLEEAGHEVYNFKRDSNFHWSEIDENWNNWTPGEYIPMLDHDLAVDGFDNDWEAMYWAEVCVLILPSGRSSHLEAGWFMGQGKPVIILLHEDGFEPELMYKMSRFIVTEYRQVLEVLEAMDVENAEQDSPCTNHEWRECLPVKQRECIKCGLHDFTFTMGTFT